MNKTRLVCLFTVLVVIGSLVFSPAAKAAVGTSPSTLNFGSVAVSTTSTATLMVTNNSRQSTVIQSVSSSVPQFAANGPALPYTLGPRSSVIFHIAFAPSAAGTFTGSIIFNAGKNGGQTTSVSVSGTGTISSTSPQTYLLTPSASGLAFGNQTVGTGTSQSLVFTNTGTGSVTVSSVTSSGTGFSVSGFPGSLTLAAGQSFSVSAGFAPASTGSVSGSITVVSTATNSPTVVSLTGTGVSPVTYQLSLSTGGLGFGNQVVGTTSALPLTLTNTGTGSVTVSQVSASGTGFGIAGFSGPVTLAPGQNTSMSVTFTPPNVNNFAGSVTVVSTATNSPASFPLSGNGVASSVQLSANPTAVNFGNVSISGGASQTQTVTLTNSGNSSVSISQIAASGTGFSLSAIALPVTLAAGQSTSFSVTFTPAVSGSVTGSIAVTSNATNSPLSISLSGTGVKPLITVTPSSIGFGNVNVGSTGTQTITVQNPGTATLSVTQATAGGTGFNLSGLTLPLSVAPGASASFNMTFTPAAAGAVSGSLTLTNNATNPALSIPVSGSGVASTLQLSANPTSLSFGNVSVSSPASQTVTVTNSGSSSVSISQVTASGTGFSLSAIALPATLAAGQSTSFSVTFAPASAGSVTGNVTVTSNATNSPLTIAMSGTGVKPLINVTPSTVSFGNVTVGVTNTQTMTVQNPGTATLSVTQATVSGTGFSVSGLTLPLSVAPGASASFNMGFAPASAGSFTGSLTLTNNATNPALSIPLSGSGVSSTFQLSANPTSLSFGSLTTGTSATQTVTLSNTGNASVTISQITASGTGFSLSSIGLPVTLAAGQTTSFNVAFEPASVGSVTGSVTVTSNAANSPLVLALSGSGAAPATHSVSLSWTASSSTYSGFNIYRGSVSGGPYTKIDSPLIPSSSYTDSNVTAGQTYYYVATEVNSTGTESGYSSEVRAAIP